ncbi:GumC family protein [Longitalea arenae]|uniref:GumC family protein n=1 Tax=Longitalea arenae TaxID=2812558 RepID=UPI0019686EF7|nr:tyrosine-protein kinase [Longitalea arenae]
MEPKYYDEPEESKGFDAKRLFSKLAKSYYWLILSAGVCLAVAFVYIRYTTPLYQASTYIQVQSPSEVTSNILGGSAFSQGPAAAAPQPDLNSEIFKLESAALIEKIVDSLNLDIEVMTEGRVLDKQLHLDSLPFIIRVSRWDRDEKTPVYKLLVREDGFRLQHEKGSVNGSYFKPLVFNHDTITIEPRPLTSIPKEMYLLRFPGLSGAVSKYSSRINASALPKGGMAMLQLSVRDEIPERAKQIVEVLLHNYDKANFEFKSKALRTEIEFLENRLATVSSELSQQANKVKDFKSTNKVNDVPTSANQILGNLVTLDSRKSENQLKENLLNQVEGNIREQSGQEQIIPNVAALMDPGLSQFVDTYNKLVLRRKEILDRGTPQDIRLPEINAGLNNLKNSIYQSINSLRQQLRTSNAFIASQEQNQTGRFQGMAEKEKDLNQTNRVLGVKDALYTFLQQKIEDKKMEYASAGIAGTRIIDWNISKSVNPKPYVIYAMAFLLGILLPVMVLVIQFMLNKKIETREDVQGVSSLPIAGEIILDNSKADLVIAEETVSPIAEQFRTLRTNISYMGYGPEQKVLMVTSCKSGEGKSFVSLNLASSLAISSKKVVLLEFDLRNPGLSERLGMKKSNGITNYLRGEVQIDDVLKAVPEIENLVFVSAGTPLPLNPGEIILLPRMKSLFDYLRAHYDYIILDTPPVEAVSDALSLGKHADLAFFILRHKFTLRPSLKLINQLHEDQKLPHISLIINGIKPGYGFQHVYGYGYEYGQMGKGKRKKKNADSNLKIA